MPRGASVPATLRLSHEEVSGSNGPYVRSLAARKLHNADSIVDRVQGLSLPPVDRWLHLTHRLDLLCRNVAATVPELRHVDMTRVLVTAARCRNRRLSGLQAKLIPLRFPDGSRTQVRSGYQYALQRFYVDDVEMEYVLSFYVPRFLNQTFEEKLVTVFHELYHICPSFSGDIRRFAGTNSVHDRSQKEYDRRMAVYVEEYLRRDPDDSLFDFLRLNCWEMQKWFGDVVGVIIPAPKLIPVRKL
ncbi:MAG: hypothetical protein ACRDD1_11395 [Planctomycetia bacterium]